MAPSRYPSTESSLKNPTRQSSSIFQRLFWNWTNRPRMRRGFRKSCIGAAVEYLETRTLLTVNFAAFSGTYSGALSSGTVTVTNNDTLDQTTYQVPSVVTAGSTFTVAADGGPGGGDAFATNANGLDFSGFFVLANDGTPKLQFDLKMTLDVAGGPVELTFIMVSPLPADASGNYSAASYTGGLWFLEETSYKGSDGNSYDISGTGNFTGALIMPTPDFSNVTIPVITYGQKTATMTGNLTADAGLQFLPAGEPVVLTVDNEFGETVATATASLQANGNFSFTNFDTSGLNVASPEVNGAFFSIDYAGDSTFNANSTGDNLAVNPATPTINAKIPSSISSGSKITITGTVSGGPTNPSTDAVAITIDGVTQDFPVSDSTGDFSATFDTSSLAVSSKAYDVTLGFNQANQDLNFTSATASGSFLVVPRAVINVSGQTIFYGQTPTVFSGTVNATSGTVNVLLNGVTVPAAVGSDGSFTASFDTGTLPASKTAYNVTYSYSGNTTVGPATTSSLLTVGQAQPAISGLNNPEVSYGTATTAVTGHVDADPNNQLLPAGEPIQASIKGTTLTATGHLDAQGNFSASFNTSQLPAGSCTVNLTYAGDTNFATAVATGSLTVDQVQPTFGGLSNPTIRYGDSPTTISGTLSPNAGQQTFPAGETVDILLGGDTEHASLAANGAFSFAFDTHALGVLESPYSIKFSYGGDTNFKSATGESTLNVQAKPTFSGLSSPTITYGTALTTISGHLNANAGDENIPAGQTVLITINGVSVAATLDDNDNFSIDFDTSKLAVPGSPYVITFAYVTDGRFLSANDNSAKLTVEKATPIFTNPTTPTVVYGTASTTITGHLSSNTEKQMVPKGETIAVTFNGVIVNAMLDASDNFSAVFNTSKLTVSNTAYQIRFDYGGDANFNDAVGFNLLTVTAAVPKLVATDAGGTFNGSPFPAKAVATGIGGITVAGVSSFKYYVGSTATGTGSITAPTNVGTYTVVASFLSSNPNYGSALSPAVKFTIKPATPRIVATDAGGAFTGKPFPATAKGTGAGGATVIGSSTFLYYTGATVKGTGTATAPTNVGTYTVVASFKSSNPDYVNASSAPLTFTIKPAVPKVVATDAGGTYNGEPFPATAVATGVGGATVSGTRTFLYTGATIKGAGSATAPTIAGTYTVVASFTSTNPNYGNASSAPLKFTIKPAVPKAVATDAGGTYNGKPFPATAAATDVGGARVTGSSTFSYYTGATVKGTGTATAPTNAGTYTVVASFTSTNSNYANTSSAPVTFTIKPAVPKVVVTDAGGTYNGEPFPATAAATGVGGATVSGTKTFLYTGATIKGTGSATAPTIAGTYTVVASLTSTNPNYANASSVSVTFTIKPALPKVVATDAGGTYTGKPFPATAVATGVGGARVTGSSTFSYYTGATVKGTGSASAPTNAGTYTVVAFFTSTNPNYGNASSAPVTFTIKPAIPKAVATDAGGTYTGKPFPATNAATGVGGATVSGSSTFLYYTGTTVKGTGSATAPTNAGTYTVVASFTSTNPNYANASSAPVTFTIKPAVPKFVATDAGGKHNGKPFPATALATGIGGVTVSGSSTFLYYTGTTVHGTGSATPPTSAGTYTVVASFKSSNPDYASASSAPLTFTIK